MSLSIVDPFAGQPYNVWTKRRKTEAEWIADLQATGNRRWEINDQVREVLHTPLDAARYMAREGMDHELSDYIDAALSNSAAHAAWIAAMPAHPPNPIAIYQNDFRNHVSAAVDAEILRCGIELPVGQVLFHGGFWMGDASDTFTTTLPLSTTLCPQVAIKEAEHRGKAYDAGELHLLVLRIENPAAKAYVFQRTGTDLGHENEVLFASGLRLERRSQILVRTDYPATKPDCPDKVIPVSVVEVAIV